MRLRDLFRRAPSSGRPPSPDPGPRPAVRQAWPDLPALQRVVSAPSLVTAPDGFRRGLASWGNPSFLSTPGHLVAPDAPSGSVVGVARQAVRWDAPPSRWPESGADDGWADGGTADGGDDAVAAALPVPVPAAEPGPVQRAVADSLPLRRLPAVPDLPAPRSPDLVTAGAAPVPEPAWRPAVPAPEPPAEMPRPEMPRAEAEPVEVAQVETPQAVEPPAEAPAVDAPTVEAAPVEATPGAGAPAETVAPVTVPAPAPVPVQTLAEHPLPPVDPIPAPRRRLGLGAPLTPPAQTSAPAPAPPGSAPAGVSPLVARLLDAPSTPAGPAPAVPSRPEPADAPSVREMPASHAGPGSVPEPVHEPAVPMPSVAEPPEEPPATVVQGDADHEETPTLGDAPLAVPPAGDLPVQRTFDVGAAPQSVPAVGSALPPPAGQFTTSPPTLPALPLPAPPPPPAALPAVTPPPVTPVQRHPDHDEAPLVGETALAAPAAEDVPVQRTVEIGAAPRDVPAVSGALPTPAGQSPTALDTGLPAGPIASPAPEPVAAPVGGRPLVARSAVPDVPAERPVTLAHEPLPAPLAQRAIDAGASQPSTPHVTAGESETPVPTGPVEGAGVAEDAGLVGEWPVAQRMTDAGSSSPTPRAEPAPETSVLVGERPVAQRAFDAPTAAQTTPVAQHTAVRPLGGRPIVLRAVAPPPAPASAPEPTPAGQTAARSAAAASVPGMLAAVGAPASAPALQRLSLPVAPAPQRPAEAAFAPPPQPAPEPAWQAPQPAEETVTVSRLESGGHDGGAVASAPPPAEMHASAPAPPGGAPSPAAVDAEVHRLFDPLTRQLTAELRLERERVGHALDLRY